MRTMTRCRPAWWGKSQVTEAVLHDHCVGRVARYMVPRRIVFLDDLPRTPTGKPAKGELKKLL